MSVQAITWAYEQRLPPVEKFFLITVSNGADQGDGVLEVGQDLDWVCRFCGFTPSEAVQIAESLVSKGLLYKSSPVNKSGQFSYFLSLEGGFIPQPEFAKDSRQNISNSLRFQVYKRDKHKCVYCGNDPDQLSVDHVMPVSRGGEDTLRNLVTCCRPCNSSKGTKAVWEWKR